MTKIDKLEHEVAVLRAEVVALRQTVESGELPRPIGEISGRYANDPEMQLAMQELRAKTERDRQRDKAALDRRERRRIKAGKAGRAAARKVA